MIQIRHGMMMAIKTRLSFDQSSVFLLDIPDWNADDLISSWVLMFTLV